MKYPNDYINHIICGDCLKVMKDIPDDSIDLIIIDPPYLVTNEFWDKEEVVNGDLSKRLFDILKDAGSLYVWCGIGEKSQSLIRWFPIFNANFYFKDLITWKKQRGIGMRRGWLYTREEIMWFVKDNKKFVWNKEEQYSIVERHVYGFKTLKSGKGSIFKRLSNVWGDIRECTFRANIDKAQYRGHFTPKPIEAIERIIKLHTKENDIVLDCFLGLGTTAIACIKLKRKCIGIEINPEYCKLTANRIKAMKITA